MNRSWIRRATIAGAVATAGACWLVGTFAVAEYDPVLTGATESRQASRRGKMIVIKRDNVPFAPGPPSNPLPDDPNPRKPPLNLPMGGKVTDPSSGLDAGLTQGVSLMATTTPQAQVETSLKNLARDLR